ncbi:MAG: hypothetical protein RR835_11565, partial [Peptostreptococcaceae bacterium]
EIYPSDIEITDEVYNTFFTNQSKGKVYRIKNPNGVLFDEIFEEIRIATVIPDNQHTLEERVAAIEIALAQSMGV